MITGTHILLNSENADADRAFFRDVLGFHSVDAGHGWLIFAVPPTEAAIHPVENAGSHEADDGRSLLGAVVYLMCEDLEAEIKRLSAKKVKCSPVETQRWGITTTIRLPSGGGLGLYQPKHLTAIDLKQK
jgi:catechol 2,3-dioxygenase-like lactoylglutathione lyase family enzyme